MLVYNKYRWLLRMGAADHNKFATCTHFVPGFLAISCTRSPVCASGKKS
jgi:hypothetical protein